MVDTRDHYNGDITIPLVNVEGQPEMNVLIPYYVANGIEGYAMRAAGPMPNVHVPATDISKDRSVTRASTKRRALYARWHESRVPLLLGRAYRQLFAYGTFAMVVVPSADASGARVVFRDALGAYPELRAADEFRDPDNVAFVYGRSPDWVLANYPQSRDQIATWQDAHPEEQLWDLAEWIDEDSCVIGLLGPRSLYAVDSSPNVTGTIPAPSGMELRRWSNAAGKCTAVVPRRVTLDRIAGQMEKIIPHEEWAAKLMALDFVAAERYVFPDMVVVGEDGRIPQIVGPGGWRDGRTGDVNLLQNVKQVMNLQGAPGPMTSQTIDRIERNAGISGGGSPFFGGETTGSLRTGRAIDSLGGYSVDPHIQEAQLIMQFALESVNRNIISLEKGYWPDRKFTVFSGWRADGGVVEYTPSKEFENLHNSVAYPFPGSDMSQITVAVSQLNGAKLMSRETARETHPFIEDPQLENRLVTEEAIDDAMLVAFEQGIVGGQVSWTAVAEYKKLIAGGESWPNAILKVHEEEQKRQAAQAQAMMQAQAGAAQGAPGGPGGPGGMPGLPQQGPDTQPGLGGGPTPTASIPPPGQGEVNLASMVRAIAAPAAAAKRNPMPVG